MKAGDRDQVADACAVEHLPVRLLDGALVTHHQGHDHASVFLFRQSLQDSFAQCRAAVLDDIGDAEDKAVDTAIAFANRPYVASGAHTLLKEPDFVVEAMRIGVPVRPLQAHRQLPAFARLHVAYWKAGIAKACVPGQRDPRRNARRRIIRGLHREVKAHALVEVIREAGNCAGQRDVAALLYFWKLVLKGQRGCQGGPAEAEQHAGGTGERSTNRPGWRPPGDAREREQCERESGDRVSRQRRLNLQQRRAGCKAE
jgi:hypothetical protein